MAGKTTLNAKNLEALGAPRLAELLIEISTGSAAHKRRLRLELAGSHGSAEVSREVRKRLASIGRARTAITWRKVKGVRAELEIQRGTIVETLAAQDPGEAFDLIWQFLGLADSIFERCDDSSGVLIESFHKACGDAGAIAASAGVETAMLARKVFSAVRDNDYGQYDGLITAMAAALGPEGLATLKHLLVQWSEEPEEVPAESKRQVIGWSMNGPIYHDEVYGARRASTIRVALEEIADAEGDVDAYIAQQPENARRTALVAADIAGRLLKAGRAEEALRVIDGVDEVDGVDLPFEWEIARVEALDALKRDDEAQAFRWACFERSLSDDHLRAFLKRLPDFDDLEAEERAFAFVHAAADPHQALDFFLRWPALAEAAKLVLTRGPELDGDLYALMTPAADALATRHPLAATVLLRAMIDFTLDHARSSRYKHAARHLLECTSLGASIGGFGDQPSHDHYVADLRRRHGKKHGFWTLMP